MFIFDLLKSIQITIIIRYGGLIMSFENDQINKIRKRTWDFQNTERLQIIIEELRVKGDIKTAQGLFIEFVREHLFDYANYLESEISISNENLKLYGLELSKYGKKQIRTQHSFYETFKSGFWEGCEIALSSSPPLRQWLLELLNTPEILDKTYWSLRERCLYTLRHTSLDREEYKLLRQYYSNEPIHDIRILAIDIDCKDPSDKKEQIKLEKDEISSRLRDLDDLYPPEHRYKFKK